MSPRQHRRAFRLSKNPCTWPRPLEPGCRRRILCHFGSSVSASCAGSQSRWLNHTFACAVHRCLLDGIPGMRLPGSAVYPRFSPLRTSRWAGGYAVTPALGGRGLHPHGKLSYEVHPHLAVFLETRVPFRPTGRTSVPAELSSPDRLRVGGTDLAGGARPYHC